MPKKSSNKKGGAFAYVDQFDYPLSPCYHPKGKPAIPKAGWHSGGSCLQNPSVSQMGIIDKPSSLQPNPSEIAWANRYSCPTKSMKGGNNVNFSVEEIVNNSTKNTNNTNNKKNKKPHVPNATNVAEMNANVINKLKEKFQMNSEEATTFFVNANKNGLNYKIVIFYNPNGNKKFNLDIKPNRGNVREEMRQEEIEALQYNTLNGVVNKIKNFELKNVSKRNSLNNNKNNNKKNKKPHVPNATNNNKKNKKPHIPNATNNNKKTPNSL